MYLNNNISPSFGSIQVQSSKMNRKQINTSNSLYDTIKYSDEYSKLSDEDIDIYILPKGKSNIEVRFMDPYSGNFVRDNNRIIKYSLDADSCRFAPKEQLAKQVLDTLQNIVSGIFKRPKIDSRKIVDGNTEMAKLNPSKAENIQEMVEEFENIGYSKKEAEDAAVEEFCSLYHFGNRDADF